MEESEEERRGRGAVRSKKVASRVAAGQVYMQQEDVGSGGQLTRSFEPDYEIGEVIEGQSGGNRHESTPADRTVRRHWAEAT